MKKYAALLLAVLMLLALAAPAAAKPSRCDGNPSLPGCGGTNEEPSMAGTECAGTTDQYTSEAMNGDFDLTLGGDFYGACVDVSNVEPSGEWTITFNVSAGTLRELLVLVRDSSPGDLCNYGMRIRHVESGSIKLEPNAADYVNSCGTQFAEMINGSYYGDADEDVQSPLAFMVLARGSDDLAVDFHVDYPNSTP